MDDSGPLTQEESEELHRIINSESPALEEYIAIARSVLKNFHANGFIERSKQRYMLSDQSKLKLYLAQYRAELEKLYGESTFDIVLVDSEIGFIGHDIFEEFLFHNAIAENCIIDHVYNAGYHFRAIKSQIYMMSHPHALSLEANTKVLNINYNCFKDTRDSLYLELVATDSSIGQLVIGNQKKAIFFRKLHLENCTIQDTPEISIESLSKTGDVHFHNLRFGIMSGGQALAAFRTLKKLCQNCDYEHGTILFHGFELEANYNTYLAQKLKWADVPEYISSATHKAFTDYGRNTMLPCIWLFLFFIFGWCAAVLGTSEATLDTAALHSLKASLGPLAALNFPYKFSDTEPLTKGGFAAWFYIQTLLSSVIWFLIIFMIRRRFKL